MFHFSKHGFYCIYLDMAYLNDEDIFLRSEHTTNLSYDKFIVFYNADPENWKFIKEGFRECNRHSSCGRDPEYVYIPEYTYKDEEGYKRHRYIKFLTRKDYKKFVKFMNKMYRTGEDHENQSEILQLSMIVGDRSRQRLEEANKEVNDAFDSIMKIQSRITDDKGTEKTSTTDPQCRECGYIGCKYIGNSSECFVKNGPVYFNEVPYKVKISFAPLYFNDGTDYNPLFIKCVDFTGCDPALGCCTLKIDKEVFYDGYTYCHIKSSFVKNRWIRISDIEEKVSE